MSLTATLLQAAVVKAHEKYAAFENRRPEDGAIGAFQKHTNEIVPAALIESLKVSFRRPVEIPVLKSKAPTITTVRAVNPTRDVAESAKVATTWISRGFNFTFTEAINSDNYISAEETISQLLLDGFKGVFFTGANSLESYLIALLEAGKYSSLPTSKVAGVTTGSGVYELESKDFVIKAPAVMRELMMSGPYQDIANIASLGRQREDATLGRYNQRNVDQYKSDFTYHLSHNLPVEAAKDETHFLVPEGSLALLNAIEDDARKRRSGDDGYYDIIVDPLFGFEWGVRVSKVAASTAGTYGTGFERTLVTNVDVQADFTGLAAYSSTSAAPIVKFNTVTTP